MLFCAKVDFHLRSGPADDTATDFVVTTDLSIKSDKDPVGDWIPITVNPADGGSLDGFALVEWLDAQTVDPNIGASASRISPRAFDMIVGFEVTSPQVYERRYRKPEWPKGASGVTIGIGYDVGYVTTAQLQGDWRAAIPDNMITALQAAINVRGPPAGPLARQLGATVDVSFDAAITVHSTRVIPLWVKLVERSLSNTSDLSPDSLGALVSLTYNRGASYSKQGDRYREMRSIKDHMAARQFARIPDDIRSMKRLWPGNDVAGLRTRRDSEAQLFQDGLG